MSDIVKNSSFVRLVFTLGGAGLVSGIILVGVYLVTLPIIQANRAEALNAAILRVVKGTETVEAMVVDGGTLKSYEGEAGKAPKGEVVYAGKDADGKLVGYAIPAEGPGFQDTIVLLIGFDPTRRVIIGMEVLESRETPGLGDKITSDAHFLSNFEALAVEPTIVGVKNGARANPNEVDTITGATISSKAVISILNKSMDTWLSIIAPAVDTTSASNEPQR